MELQAAASAKKRTLRGTAKPIAVPVDEAMQMAGIGKTLLYELISQGKLKSVAVGRRRLVLVASIEALLRPADAA